MEQFPKTVYQFKYWLWKYLSNFGTAIRNQEGAKVARYVIAATALEELTRKLGVKLYHLRPSTMLSVGSVTARQAQNTITHISKGQYGKAVSDVATTVTPGGRSLMPTAKKLLEGDFDGAFKEFLPLEKVH